MNELQRWTDEEDKFLKDKKASSTISLRIYHNKKMEGRLIKNKQEG